MKYAAINTIGWICTVAGALATGAGVWLLITLWDASKDALTVLLTGGTVLVPLAVGLFLFANGQILFLIINVAHDVHRLAWGVNE